jgi:hypothetical protein
LLFDIVFKTIGLSGRQIVGQQNPTSKPEDIELNVEQVVERQRAQEHENHSNTQTVCCLDIFGYRQV